MRNLCSKNVIQLKTYQNEGKKIEAIVIGTSA